MKACALVLGFLLLLLPVTAQAQDIVRNPSAAVFEASADHDRPDVTGYELDIIRESDGAVIQTIQIDKAALTQVPGTTPQQFRAAINVQPVAFGMYVSRVRTVAGAVKSVDSDASNVWQRSPGRPSRVEMQ